MEKAGPKGRARPSCSLSTGEAGLAQRAAQLVDAREHGVAFGAAVMSIGQPLAVVIANALGKLRQGHGFIISESETHVVIAVEIAKATLTGYRRLFERLIEAADERKSPR